MLPPLAEYRQREWIGPGMSLSICLRALIAFLALPGEVAGVVPGAVMAEVLRERVIERR